MAITVNIDSITLDILSTRLKNIVSPIDILMWLGNFKEEELTYALDFIKNLTVFTSNDIEEVYHEGLIQILKSVPKEGKIVIHPIGAFGKSGSMMTYLFRKTDCYNLHKKRISLCPQSSMLDELSQNHKTLVLLDDFIGTGKTVRDYYESDISLFRKKFKTIIFLGVAGIKQGVENIKPLFDSVLIQDNYIYKKAFSSNASYFGYRKHTKHRELAYKYGEKLTKPKKLKYGGLKYFDALGFGNSQGLVAFFYGCPNNTLPIFWRGNSDRQKWTPLIPRFNNHKITMAREFRKRISFELSIFREFGSENLKANFSTYEVKKGIKRFNSVNHLDFSLYAILKLLRKGMSEFQICQRLGISHSDFLGTLKDGKTKGIFDKRGKITLKGLELFQDAKICIDKNLKYYDKMEKTNLPKIYFMYRNHSMEGRREQAIPCLMNSVLKDCS